MPFALKCKLKFAGIKAQGRITREFYAQRGEPQPVKEALQPVRPTASRANTGFFAQWPEHVQRAWKAAVKSRRMSDFIKDFPMYAGQAGMKQRNPEFNAG